MTLRTSRNFASASASGTDWRDTAKKVVEQLQGAMSGEKHFTLGLIYVTDHLARDVRSILTLLKSVTHVEHWSGTIGVGIFGGEKVHWDEPAISVMLMDVPEDSFRLMDIPKLKDAEYGQKFNDWLSNTETMLALWHIGAVTPSLGPRLQEMSTLLGGYFVGGAASARTANMQGVEKRSEDDVSGIVFSADTPVAVGQTQGIRPIGPEHIITFTENEHIIRDLDHKRCFEVFQDDLKSLARERIGIDPDEITLSEDALESGEFWDEIPVEFRSLFQGEVHIAFPIAGSDRGDMVVGNISGIDRDMGMMSVSHQVFIGDSIRFVQRTPETIREGLVKSLENLKERIISDHGEFKPKGAIYISCVARAAAKIDEGADADAYGQEYDLVRKMLGDIPITGFYAGGEILNAQLYGNTAIITVFV